MLEHSPKIIAVAGKGGVGKTSISAAFVRLLTEAYPDKRILAIDADPAVGLSTALGVEVKETLDDIRKSIVASVEDGAPREAIELLSEARYRIFDTMVEQQRFSFLAIGRPETAGCYCKVNAYLKEVINLLANDFDYVVIDGEAGIEQINRRVMEKVTHLVLITDPSRKGTQVIDTRPQGSTGQPHLQAGGRRAGDVRPLRRYRQSGHGPGADSLHPYQRHGDTGHHRQRPTARRQ